MTNTTNTTTTNNSAEFQQRVNDAAINGIQRLLDASGKIAADGHLKMAITVKLTVKASEDGMDVHVNDRTRSTHAVADVDLTVNADIDGFIAITGDGSCHGQRR